MAMNVLRCNQFAFESLFSLPQVDILFLRCLHTVASSKINIPLNNHFLTKPLFGDILYIQGAEKVQAETLRVAWGKTNKYFEHRNQGSPT